MEQYFAPPPITLNGALFPQKILPHQISILQKKSISFRHKKARKEPMAGLITPV